MNSALVNKIAIIKKYRTPNNVRSKQAIVQQNLFQQFHTAGRLEHQESEEA